MAYIKWTFRIFVILLVGGFLHYTLPQRDIVRIVNTYEERQDFGGWNSIFWSGGSAGTAETPVNRDVLFISTKTADDDTIVFRNEDTGWGWPPYFKFDSSDLQAEASANLSPAGAEKWVLITHYGWRNRFFTIYPNAVGIRPIDGPDVRIIPWVNIIFFTFLIFAYFFLRAMWRQFRERSIDPMLEDAGEAWDKVEDHAGAAQERATGVMGRLRAWLATWRKKP